MELQKIEGELEYYITSNTPLEDILIEPPPNNERTEHDARTFEDLFGADEEASFIWFSSENVEYQVSNTANHRSEQEIEEFIL